MQMFYMYEVRRDADIESVRGDGFGAVVSISTVVSPGEVTRLSL